MPANRTPGPFGRETDALTLKARSTLCLSLAPLPGSLCVSKVRGLYYWPGDQPLANRERLINEAVSYLDRHAEDKSTGYCARYVREAIEHGFGLTLVRPSSNSAKDYGGALEKAGFKKTGDSGDAPEVGDVVIIDPPPGHKDGHMAMYDGTQWVSDFKQRTLYPGESYRTSQPRYTIYRWP